MTNAPSRSLRSHCDWGGVSKSFPYFVYYYLCCCLIRISPQLWPKSTTVCQRMREEKKNCNRVVFARRENFADCAPQLYNMFRRTKLPTLPIVQLCDSTVYFHRFHSPSLGGLFNWIYCSPQQLRFCAQVYTVGQPAVLSSCPQSSHR